jgi:hypothetical protein
MIREYEKDAGINRRLVCGIEQKKNAASRGKRRFEAMTLDSI